jgi:hypothetical protein
MSSSQVIGMPWYRSDDYARLREMMTDPHSMAPDYEAWRASAENNEQVAKAAGLSILRVAIDPETFSEWCAERRLPLNSGARMRFANEAAGRRST